MDDYNIFGDIHPDEDMLFEEMVALWGNVMGDMHGMMNEQYHGLRNVPTHTEDGIPIRKVYVSNLPRKTTRSELYSFFAQYGYIKSCWVKKSDNQTEDSSPYAFVTFIEPADAHMALVAPAHERMLRGKQLRVLPADSWHQPSVEADGTVRWPARRVFRTHQPAEATEPEDTQPSSSQAGGSVEQEPEYNIMDILNPDCLAQVLSYLSLPELVRTERVSKRWCGVVRDYLHSIRTFKTSSWKHSRVTLTTAVLRHLLLRLGPTLTSFCIDHHWSALNDRTAHIVGKFCPNLLHFEVVGMLTRNWNPIIYGCKQLQSISFISCNKLYDDSLTPLVNKDSSIESLSISTNTHISGLFLSCIMAPNLHSISLHNCYNLQGHVLLSALSKRPQLKSLKLDQCPMTLWIFVPGIIEALPNLEDLSLTEYCSSVPLSPNHNEVLCNAMSKLTELRTLCLTRNVYVNDALIKCVAKNCTKLRKLDISGCNARRTITDSGVSEAALTAVGRECRELRSLDASYLALLSAAGVAALANCAQLATLVARGNPALTDAPLVTVLQSCHQLEEVDVCGCEGVTEGVVAASVAALQHRPRQLSLYLAATGVAADMTELPTHSKLSVNTSDDRSMPHLRPDFKHQSLADSDESSESFDEDDIEDFYSDVDYDFDEDDYDDLELEHLDQALQGEFGPHYDIMFM